MKRTLSILSIAVFIAGIAIMMAACNSSPKKDATNLTLSADTTGLADFQAWKAVNERKDPMVYYNQGSPAPVNTVTTSRRTTQSHRAATTTSSRPVTQVSKKKGWSKSAKGAVIGTTVGAVAGAVINKRNRLLGGVIGGVLGGGLGYGLGRHMDKQDGRY
jgi:hypothetical protein